MKRNQQRKNETCLKVRAIFFVNNRKELGISLYKDLLPIKRARRLVLHFRYAWFTLGFEIWTSRGDGSIGFTINDIFTNFRIIINFVLIIKPLL